VLVLLLPLCAPGVVKRDLSGTTCSALYCANSGQACGVINNTAVVTETDCYSDNICSITSSTLDGIKGTCIPTPGPDQSCSGKCLAGYLCINSTCKLGTSVPRFGPGIQCVTDEECYFMRVEGSLYQMTHLCTGGYCNFLMEGQHCSVAASQCNVLTSFCNFTDQTCHPYLASGAMCNVTLTTPGCVETCAPIAISGSAGACANLYSVAAGNPCFLDSQCNEGLYCGQKQLGQDFGVCSAVVNTSTLHKPCKDDTNCSAANREYCGCFSKYGPSPVCVVDIIPPGYAAALQAYESCAFKCALSDGEYNNTCVLASCLEESCRYVQLSNSVSDVLNNCFTQHVLLPLCDSLTIPTLPISSIIVTTSLSYSVAAPLLFVFLLIVISSLGV
jgi:hypothetical protein